MTTANDFLTDIVKVHIRLLVDLHRLCLLVVSSSDIKRLRVIAISFFKVGGNDAFGAGAGEGFGDGSMRWCEEHLAAFTHIVPPGQGGGRAQHHAAEGWHGAQAQY